MFDLSFSELIKLLPHRYPFLLVDRVLDYQEGKSLLALKNVSSNEDFFNGHFPGRPIMPGVLQIEAVAQAAAVLIFLITKTHASTDNWYYFAGIKEARFKRVVVPGDQLHLYAEVKKRKGNQWWWFTGQATVDGEVACSLEFMVAKGVVSD